MDSQRAYQIIDANLAKLVGEMVTVPKGASLDVFCDVTGTNLSFSTPSGAANIKLCAVTAPDPQGALWRLPPGGRVCQR